MDKYGSSIVPSDESIFDKMGYIDDEVDCAILRDDDFEKALSNIDECIDNNNDKCVKESESYDEDYDDFEDDEIDDIIDSNQDYSNDVVDNTVEGLDADEMLAAERDLAFDPFEDDEIIDAVIDADKDTSPESLANDDI